jgi:nitrate reductase gamma subunit
MFNRRTQGVAMLLFHWGILAVLLGHISGFVGGALGLETFWIDPVFYWLALIGGLMTLAGAVIALTRRIVIPEVRAMSQTDDYIVLLFLIAILGVALYQVIFQEIFGLVGMVAPWFASIWAFSPDPELMEGMTLLSQIHVLLALTFFAYFPFTKLVHFWTLPVNYFVRPYQVMRTNRFRFEDKWEFSLRSDKSYMAYLASFIVIGVVILSTYILISQG